MNSLELNTDNEETDKAGRKRQHRVSTTVNEMINRYDTLLFCSAETSKEWFKWNGMYWEQIDPIEVRDLIYELIVELAPGCERISLIQDVLGLIAIKMRRSMLVPPSNCINFLNGILDLDRMELVPHNPDLNLLAFLRELVPSRCVELSCSKSNIFERARLMHAALIIISEGDYLNLETIRLLKIILGRDPIPFDLKHENVEGIASFQSEAVVFVT
jgi:hypothetical protein